MGSGIHDALAGRMQCHASYEARLSTRRQPRTMDLARVARAGSRAGSRGAVFTSNATVLPSALLAKEFTTIDFLGRLGGDPHPEGTSVTSRGPRRTYPPPQPVWSRLLRWYHGLLRPLSTGGWCTPRGSRTSRDGRLGRVHATHEAAPKCDRPRAAPQPVRTPRRAIDGAHPQSRQP